MRSQRSDGAILTRTHRLHQRLLRYLRSTPLAASLVPCTLSISHSKRFVWYRVPKVGSSSISHHFERQGVRLDVVEPRLIHLPYRRYRDYFKFAFVRNPWDRLVSCWKDKVVKLNIFEFDQSEHEHMQHFPNFVDWVARQDLETCNEHIRLQCRMIDLSMIDFLGRLERFDDDLAQVFHRLAISRDGLKRLNVSPGNADHRRHYDERSAEVVAELYQRDIQIFGYRFDGP